MLQALGPTDIADVYQTFHALFNFDEGAEIGKVANTAIDERADGIFLGGGIPRVGHGLFQTKRDPALIRLHFQYGYFYFVAGLHHFRRMLAALRPTNPAAV